MNRNSILGVASLFLTPFIIQNSAAAISLDFAAPSTAEVGQQVDVGIVISGLGDGGAPSLGTFDFDVNFDSSMLSFDSVAFGDPALGGNQLDIFDIASDFFEFIDSNADAGIVNLSGLSLDGDILLDVLQPNTFTVATLVFKAINDGTSILEFDNIILGDALGNSLVLLEVNNTSVEVEPGVATTVSESSTTFSLLTLGLLCLGTAINCRYR